VEVASSQLISPRDDSQRPIRVLIDGRKIGDGGIGVYIENLVSGLCEIGGVQVSLIARSSVCTPLLGEPAVRWIFDKARSYSLDELVLMARRLDLRSYDVFHAPHYMLPLRLPVPAVVTVHDLIHITHPEKFYYPFVARTLIGSAIKRADAVVAVSEATRSQLLDTFRVSPSKVSVVPNAVARFVSDSVGEPACSDPTETPFFLSVLSNVEPHKGLADLIQAYRIYRDSLAWKEHVPCAPRLVLAGYGTAALQSDSALSRLVDVAGIEVRGSLSDAALGALYRSATALVVPAYIEGFCLPALEAQAVGVPVVCRPVAAIKELLTDRDVVSADFSVGALTQVLHEGLLRGLSSDRAVFRPHLARYSRATVAHSVRDIYRQVSSLGNA
jgi:glycosyltransferase involved in cell wall biosynthesis